MTKNRTSDSVMALGCIKFSEMNLNPEFSGVDEEGETPSSGEPYTYQVSLKYLEQIIRYGLHERTFTETVP